MRSLTPHPRRAAAAAQRRGPGSRIVLGGLLGLVVLTLLGPEIRGLPAGHDAAVPAGPAIVRGAVEPSPSPAQTPASITVVESPAAVAARAMLAEQQVQSLRTKLEGDDQPQSKAGAFTQIVVPDKGSGRYAYAHEKVRPASDRGALRRYDVRVEKGLALDPDQTATTIAKVLNDERSWRGSGRWRFQLVSAGQRADLHIYLVTPGTTDRLCAPLLTRGEVSCQAGNKVVLNAKRWMFGVKYYGDDLKNYRRYLVNHEVGHSLGYNHVRCPGPGRPAPVMMQQTKGLEGCRKNPWPRSAGD
jgi:hypothetical protein